MSLITAVAETMAVFDVAETPAGENEEIFHSQVHAMWAVSAKMLAEAPINTLEEAILKAKALEKSIGEGGNDWDGAAVRSLLEFLQKVDGRLPANQH